MIPGSGSKLKLIAKKGMEEAPKVATSLFLWATQVTLGAMDSLNDILFYIFSLKMYFCLFNF